MKAYIGICAVIAAIGAVTVDASINLKKSWVSESRAELSQVPVLLGVSRNCKIDGEKVRCI